MSNISGAARGCWTCRLRRKKCSGEQPICSICTSLNVTCYGYNLIKPSWMDGGRMERERLVEIQKRVKLTTDSQRRPRALHGLKLSKERKSSDRPASIVWESTNSRFQSTTSLTDIPPVSSSDWEFSKNTSASPTIELFPERSKSELERPESRAVPTNNPTPLLGLATVRPNDYYSSTTRQIVDHEEDPLPWLADPELESILLMYYFDFVCPIQFPFYKPRQTDGGRGWILALLMRTKPLYNAALCLAAYHQKLTTSVTLNPSPLLGVRNDQERFYALALRGLRQHIGVLSEKGEREGLRDSIDILCCVNQLIMFEVARGGFENWQRHLMAAPDIFPFLQTYCTHSQLPLQSSTHPTVPTSPYLSFVDHAAYELNTAVIIWVDILGSASTGQRPLYSDICTDGLGDNSKLQLKIIMGCENWAMVLIREIAVLVDWKRQMIEKGTFNIRDLVMAADAIERGLDTKIKQLTLEISNIQDTSSLRRMKNLEVDNLELVIARITHAFAGAAKVYLTVLVSGPNPDIAEIVKSVDETLDALSAFPDPKLLRHAVWPFCIAGCMASPPKRQRFRDLASAAGIHRNVFGTSWRALEVIETCWSMRDDGRREWKNCDWLDAMKMLGRYVLLI